MEVFSEPDDECLTEVEDLTNITEKPKSLKLPKRRAPRLESTASEENTGLGESKDEKLQEEKE